MRKKGSLELSTEGMVIIGLALVGLILGIAFIVELDQEARDTTSLMGDQLDRKNINMMLQSSRVAVPNVYETVEPGSLVSFEMGVKNTLGQDQSFFVAVQPQECPECSQWIRSLDANQESFIKNGKIKYYLVAIDIPKDAPKGRYDFQVRVCYDHPGADTQPPCHGSYDDYYMGERYKGVVIEVE